MAGFLSYAGWATFGILVRCYQQGIRKMPFTLYPEGLAYSAAFWVGFGYFFNQWNENNDRLLDKRLTNLQDARAKRALLVEE